MASEYKPNAGVLSLTASTTLNADAYGGKCIALNAAAGLTVTLPAATGSGTCFEIVVGTTVTSNSYVIQVANATDIMGGTAILTTDTSGIVVPTAATSDTITMDGSTKGGIKGGTIVLRDVASGLWSVFASLNTTGAEATPFSAAVS